MNWPIDSNGKPMVKVSNGAKETIPTAAYANITLGPAYVEKYVEDDPQAIVNGLAECLAAAEKVLGAERDKLLRLIQSSGAK